MTTEEIFKKIRAGVIRHYGEMRSEAAVVGLSGGVDSAVAAKIMIDVIGIRKVKLFFLPYSLTDKRSYEDANAFADKFKLPLETVSLTEIADRYFVSDKEMTPLRIGNFLSRLRMNILFDQSAKNKGVVIGTSNKTEILLGYGTWYGDMASSLNPIGDIYKFQVYELAKYFEIPTSITLKKPTADLWQDQTDEGELGYSYAEIDNLFIAIIDKKYNREKLYAEFDKKFVDDILHRVKINSFKRRLPTVCRVTETENIDEIFNKI